MQTAFGRFFSVSQLSTENAGRFSNLGSRLLDLNLTGFGGLCDASFWCWRAWPWSKCACSRGRHLRVIRRCLGETSVPIRPCDFMPRRARHFRVPTDGRPTPLAINASSIVEACRRKKRRKCVSTLSKDRLKGLSVERLMRFLTSLNHDVAIVIREPAAQDASS